MRDIVVHESGQEIDLQAPTVANEILLRAIRGRRGGANRGELLCRKHGGALYLQDRHGTIFACHWPGTGGAPHPVALMSEEHRVQVEYIARAAEREGLHIEKEKVLPHVRPDLVVNGSTAFEVQRSHVTVAEAKGRTTKAVHGGMNLSLWISDRAADRPPLWLHRVPSARVHAAEWKRLPAVGAATVESGLSQFTRERCYGAHDRRCITASHRCTGWRLRREPVLGVTLDRLSVGLAFGVYVPAEVAGNVHLVETALAKDLGVVWSPPLPARTPRIDDGGYRVECRTEPSSVAAEPVEPVERAEPMVGNASLPTYLWRRLTRGRCIYECAAPARFYLCGWRCDKHAPVTGAARQSFEYGESGY